MEGYVVMFIFFLPGGRGTLFIPLPEILVVWLLFAMLHGNLLQILRLFSWSCCAVCQCTMKAKEPKKTRLVQSQFLFNVNVWQARCYNWRVSGAVSNGMKRTWMTLSQTNQKERRSTSPRRLTTQWSMKTKVCNLGFARWIHIPPFL